MLYLERRVEQVKITIWDVFGRRIKDFDAPGPSGSLRGFTLDGEVLSYAALSGWDFQEADLYWALLFEADLRETNLSGADLRGACLRNANLQGAILDGANLGSDNLGGATELQGANLDGASLCGARLCGAQYDSNTRFPNEFNPAMAGMVLVNL